MEEIWKDVVGFEGAYQVSSFGNVRSLDRYVLGKLNSVRLSRGTIFKLQKSHKGYKTIILHKNGKPHQKQVHRLVAEAFIPNPQNLPQVNHKDTNKENNCIDNLEWITNYDNMQHAIRNGRFGGFTEKQKKSVLKNLEKCHKARIKSVMKLDDCGNILARYNSIAEAQTETGVNNSKISMCCKGKRKTAGGFCWKYEKEMKLYE